MTDRANVQTDTNKLKDFNKIWDGLPMKHFVKNWFTPFIMALGSVVMDGHSLRDTWNAVDPGANGAGTAAQQAHTLTRNRRIFSTLINYIDPTSAVRDYLISDFNDDGILALTYIRQDDVGNLPLSPDEAHQMQMDWDAMNMENTGITISDNCILKWGNSVQQKGSLFPTAKTNQEMYNKFMNGLPVQLQGKVMDERESPNANFLIGANYVAPHPLAGAAHPQAGQVDLKKVIAYFNRVWTRMIQQKLVKLPTANSVTDEEAFWAGRGKGNWKGKGKGPGGKGYKGKGGDRGNGATPEPIRELNEKVCCYKCGGLGHVARIKCKDGSWLYCATQSQISNDVLNGIKYPHIPSAPERRAAQANEAQAEEPEQVCEEVEEETEEERAQFAAAGDDAESDAFADY